MTFPLEKDKLIRTFKNFPYHSGPRWDFTVLNLPYSGSYIATYTVPIISHYTGHAFKTVHNPLSYIYVCHEEL